MAGCRQEGTMPKAHSAPLRRLVALVASGCLAAFVAVSAWAQAPVAAPPDQPEALPAAADQPPGREAIPTKNMLSVFHDGGPIMYPIALCSFLLLVFVFERLVSLRRGRVIPGPFTKRFLEQLREGQLDREKAIKLCEENKSPVAVVFAAAVKKWGKTSVEVEQAILDAGERVTNQLRRHLRLFNGISQVAPLLGLLGTVMGMIMSFNAIAASAAEGQREMMAEGIAQALITTAAGMLVAIPALLAYLFFLSRVDNLITSIDALGQQVVEIIASDSSENRSRRAKAA
jgi:biopolymer transport protein ExbB